MSNEVPLEQIAEDLAAYFQLDRDAVLLKLREALTGSTGPFPVEWPSLPDKEN